MISHGSEMPLRRAGQSGLYLPAIGLGMTRWGAPVPGFSKFVDAAEGFAILDRALELGVTHWDTASGYGGGAAECIVGNFFAARGEDVRARVILSTKWCGTQGCGRGALRKAVEGCLRRLQTDYLDIFMLHNPGLDARGNYLAPLEETWGALDDLVSQGKIHYPGISNAHGINLRDAAEALARVAKDPSRRLAVVENCYNLLQPYQVGRGLWTEWGCGSSEQAFFTDLDRLGCGLIPYWPLCAGALSGRYRKGNLAELLAAGKVDATFRAQYLEGRTVEAIEQLALVAERKGVTLAQLAIAWLLSKPQVASVINGITRIEQLDENAAAAHVALSAEEVAALEQIAAGAETVDEFCARYFR